MSGGEPRGLNSKVVGLLLVVFFVLVTTFGLGLRGDEKNYVAAYADDQIRGIQADPLAAMIKEQIEQQARERVKGGAKKAADVAGEVKLVDTSGKKVLPYPDEANVPVEPCEAEEVSTKPLTSFQFWGKTMDTTAACPTSGMNNQMQMLMFFYNCKEQLKQPTLKWKDISCSPTGGKRNGGMYAVGSSSYDYSWFRWSSLFNVTTGGICYSDKYSWSMHPWLKSCNLKKGYNKFYATPAYWAARRHFDFRQSFYTEAELFLSQIGLADKPFLAVHLRRGDYGKFCKEITKPYKKLRLPHWKYASSRGTRDLYSKHMDSCAPGKSLIVAGINKLLKLHGLSDVLMATTDPEFKPGAEGTPFTSQIQGKVHAFDSSGYHMSAAAFTAIDSILLARATHKLLNRYSTLSLTAVDLAVMHNWFQNDTMWFW